MAEPRWMEESPKMTGQEYDSLTESGDELEMERIEMPTRRTVLQWALRAIRAEAEVVGLRKVIKALEARL